MDTRTRAKIAPIASVQSRYNLTDRASEDVLRYCEQRGIAFIPWLPVAPATTASARRPSVKTTEFRNASSDASA